VFVIIIIIATKPTITFSGKFRFLLFAYFFLLLDVWQTPGKTMGFLQWWVLQVQLLLAK